MRCQELGSGGPGGSACTVMFRTTSHRRTSHNRPKILPITLNGEIRLRNGTRYHLFGVAMAESDSDVEIKVDQNGSATVVANPLDPSTPLKRPLPGVAIDEVYPQSKILPGDSATTQAEKFERHGPLEGSVSNAEFPDPAPKRVKMDRENSPTFRANLVRERRRGEAPIKPE